MKKAIKILVSDYDGTLSYNGTVSQRDIDAINLFRSKGNKFGIATGRNKAGVLEFLSLPIDFIICSSGAVIYDNKLNKLYSKKGIIGDYIFDLQELAKEYGASNLVITDDDNWCKLNLNDLSENADKLKNISQFDQCNSYFSTVEAAVEFVNAVKRELADNISIYRNCSCIDMPTAGVSKSTGIAEYAKLYASPEIYTIGDNDNDIPMISDFCGFAVSNACDSLKKAAKNHCDRIADAIEIILEG